METFDKDEFGFWTIEDEKYLCKLNRMNSYRLFEEQKKRQTEMGIADANADYKLVKLVERQCIMVEAIIVSRMQKN